MRDKDKTKDQLIDELVVLRQKIKELNETACKLNAFRLLYQDPPVPYQSLDKNGRRLHVNQAWINPLGYNSTEELQEALIKLKILSGLLTICANCKKIRDDKGYWRQVESYISKHSEAEFSHAICPECAKMLYPEEYEDV